MGEIGEDEGIPEGIIESDISLTQKSNLLLPAGYSGANLSLNPLTYKTCRIASQNVRSLKNDR